MRFKLFAIPLLCFLLVSCAGTSTPATTTPTPPQVTASTSINSFAQVLNAATTGLIAARDNGKLSQSDLTAAESVITVLATTGKQLVSEMKSTDTWEVQKAAIVKIITDAGVKAAVAKLPPSASALLAAAIGTFNQISSSAGGPVI